MGIIDNELHQINTAIYGEEMRKAIHDGLDKLEKRSSVVSVAGKTGEVTLDSNDVGFSIAGTYARNTVGESLKEAYNTVYSVADDVARLAANNIPYNMDQFTPSTETIADVVDELSEMALGAYPTDIVSGGVASFSDGADNIPVKSLTVEIKPKQTGSGLPSISNIRSISGLTGAEITRCGSNLADISKFIKGQDTTNVTFPETNACRIVTDGQGGYRSARIPSTDMIYPVGTYYIKFKVKADPIVNSFTRICLRTANGDDIRGNSIFITSNTTDESYEATFVTTEDTYLSYVANGDTTGSEYSTDVTIYDLFVSKIDVPYEPYVKKSYDVPFLAGSDVITVYGGTLDVITGFLVVDSAYVVFDGSNDEIIYTELNGQRAKISNGAPGIVQKSGRIPLVCNIGYTESGSEPNTTFATSDGSIYHYFQTTPMTVDQFRAQLNRTPMQIVYKLASSTTYQLSPTEVMTLLENNSFYADCGDITVKYRISPAHSNDSVNAELDKTNAITLGAYPTGSVFSPYITTFSDGAEDVPVKNLTTSIKSYTTKGGVASPSNYKAINGFTNVRLGLCRKNLVDISKLTGIAGVTVTRIDEGEYRIVTDGSSTYRAANINFSNMTYPPGTYYIKFKVKANPIRNDYTCIVLRTIEGNNHEGNYIQITDSDTDKLYTGVFTTNRNCYFSYIGNGNTTGSEYATDVTIYDLIISKVDIPYEPYVEENTVNMAFPSEAGIVYGGILDVTNGTLTVTHGIITFNGTTVGFTTKGSAASRDVYYRGISDGSIFDGRYGYLTEDECNEAGLVCSVAPFKNSNDTSPNYFATAYIGMEGTQLQLRLSINLSEGIDTVEKVNQFAKNLYDANTPIRYVYPLKNPVTYQLTPTEVATVLGYNSIYSNCGDISLTYRADPTLFASKDQTEDDMVANSSIANGAYFQIGNTLYKATTAIATGETIAPGTNCVITSIVEALNLLNA